MYNAINESFVTDGLPDTDESHTHIAYGYGRLDAFGRIFNRVIEHLLTLEQIKQSLAKIPQFSASEIADITHQSDDLLSASDREYIVQKAYKRLTKDQGLAPKQAIKTLTKALRNNTFNPANAPVSYPFLWDIAQHDYVQWNGIGANAGLGPLGRNTGEVIGVFATLDWHQTDSCNIASVITGQCSLFGKKSKSEQMRFTSSVDKTNLRKIEHLLSYLTSPQWQDTNLKGVLPAIDTQRAKQGHEIYQQRCVMCHQDIVRDDPFRKVVAFMGDIDKVKTDHAMAMNSVTYKGKSGFLKDLYTGVPSTDVNLVMEESMPVAALLTITTKGVVGSPDPDKSTLYSSLEWLFNISASFNKNDIKASNKMGDYQVSTPNDLFAPLKAYKGRPLNGIWATAPYLHNGSVPTLYDLFLPTQCPTNTPCKTRPQQFKMGARQFDPVKVGLKYQGYDGFTFDTRLPGNSNKGHEYATCRTPIPTKSPSWQCKPLDHEQRVALVEYLKTL